MPRSDKEILEKIGVVPAQNPNRIRVGTYTVPSKQDTKQRLEKNGLDNPTWEDIKQYIPKDRKPEYLQPIPPQGQVVVRIFPAAPEGMFGRKMNPVATSQQMHCMPSGTVPCNKVLDKENFRFKGNCPICDEYNNVRLKAKKFRNDSAAYQSLTTAANHIGPVERYYVNVAGWNDESQSYDDPKVLSMSRTLFKTMKERRNWLRKRVGEDPLDLYKGRDFKIVKRLRNSYSAYDQGYSTYDQSFFIPQRKPLCGKALTVDLQKKLAKLHDLCRLHTYLTEDELSDLVVEWRKEHLPKSLPGKDCQLVTESEKVAAETRKLKNAWSYESQRHLESFVIGSSTGFATLMGLRKDGIDVVTKDRQLEENLQEICEKVDEDFIKELMGI